LALGRLHLQLQLLLLFLQRADAVDALFFFLPTRLDRDQLVAQLADLAVDGFAPSDRRLVGLLGEGKLLHFQLIDAPL